MKSKSIHAAIAICVVLIIGTLCTIFFLNQCTKMPAKAVYKVIYSSKRIIDGLERRGFNIFPKIINSVNVIEFGLSKQVTELTTIKKSFRYEKDYPVNWLGSTKNIHLEGEYVAHFGYDLRDKFELVLHQSENEKISVELKFPQSRLLSLEENKITVTEDNGWWHKINDNDRNKANTVFKSAAREYIKDNKQLLKEAETSLREQIISIIQNTGYDVMLYQQLPDN